MELKSSTVAKPKQEQAQEQKKWKKLLHSLQNHRKKT